MLIKFIKADKLKFLLQILIDFIAEGGSALGAIVTVEMFSVLATMHFEHFFRLQILALVFMLCADIFGYYSVVLSKSNIQNFNHRIRAGYVQQITSVDHDDHMDVDEAMNTMTNDLAMFSDKQLWGFLKIMNAIIKIGLTIGALFLFHWSLVLGATVLAVLMLLLPQLLQKRLEHATDLISKNNKRLIAALNDWLSGLYELRWNRAVDKLWQIINPKAAALEKSYVDEAKIDNLVGTMGNVMASISTVSLTLLSVELYMHRLVPFGMVVNIGTFVFQLFTGLVTISNNIGGYIAGRPIAKKYLHIDLQPVAPGSDNQPVPSQIPVRIQVKGLSYSYGNKVIKFPDFTIHENEKTAIVGPSGAGKTTLIRILTGELANYQGSATLNGQEISSIPREALIQSFGVMPQHTHLFTTSMKENIALFDKTLNSAIPAAIDAVNLGPVVANLPDGLDTVLSQDGTVLSGGEGQRVSMARAIVRKKRGLIIDEGTSALDESNAREIVHGILNLRDTTVVMITHTSDKQLLADFDQMIALVPA